MSKRARRHILLGLVALLVSLRGLATLWPSRAGLALYNGLGAVALDDAMPAASIDASAWWTWPAHRQAQLAVFRRILDSSEEPNDVLVFAAASRFARYLGPSEAGDLFEERIRQLRQDRESRLYLAVALLPLAGRAGLCEGLGAAADLPTAYTGSGWPQASPTPPALSLKRKAFEGIVARCLPKLALSS